jgi:outer membrane protein W
MKKTNLLLLSLAIVLIGSTAYAELPKSYSAFKAGVYSPSSSHDIDTFNAGKRTDLDSKTGFAGEIAAGYYFLPMVALELGVGYFESKGSAEAQPEETKLKVIPLTATGKALVQLGIFEPYGLFGIGAYITDLNVSNNTGTLRGSTEVTYGLHAGAGLNINFQEKMFAGVEAKYLWANPSFGGQHLKLDGFLTTAVVGFRY